VFCDFSPEKKSTYTFQKIDMFMAYLTYTFQKIDMFMAYQQQHIYAIYGSIQVHRYATALDLGHNNT